MKIRILAAIFALLVFVVAPTMPLWAGIVTATGNITSGAPLGGGYTETDPVYNSEPASTITAANITGWSTQADATHDGYMDMGDWATLYDHSARHERLGADQLDITPLLITSTGQMYVSSGANDQFTETLSGGGSTTCGYTTIAATSHSDAGDYAGKVVSSDLWFYYPNSDSRVRWTGVVQTGDVTDVECWWGLFEDTTTFPTTTSKHVGFRLVNGTLYASNGDGTNGEQTQVLTGLGAWWEKTIAFYYGADDIKFYVLESSTSPAATHSVDRPSSAGLYMGVWSKNTGTDSVLCKLGGVKIRRGD